MKKMLLCTLMFILWMIISPQTASSHPYEEPSQSINISDGE